MNTNLELIVKESGLEKTKADYILQKFTDYFRIAAEWEARAQTIIVTNAEQLVEMQLARTGRLFLREKRIAIENCRKELKEQALREGKAIDGIANVLKALIVPIEDYLDRQEHYVEIKAAEKAEADRIAKEKADAEERERQRIENIRLKEEAERREKIIQEQKAKAEAERKAHEEVLRKEREKVEAERKIAAAKAEAERKVHEEILEAERRKREAEVEKAKAKQAELKKKIEIEKKKLITCPFCKKQFRSES